MTPPRPAKRLVAGGYQFFYDRYELSSKGFVLAGMRMHKNGREALGYLFSKAGKFYLGTHAVHRIANSLDFLDAIEHYHDVGISAPTGDEAGRAMVKEYHAYQLTGRPASLRLLEGPMRQLAVGRWSELVLAEDARDDRKLRPIWESVNRTVRSDVLARKNVGQGISVPEWFAAYWVDRLSVSRGSRVRIRQVPRRSPVPRIPLKVRL